MRMVLLLVLVLLFVSRCTVCCHEKWGAQAVSRQSSVVNRQSSVVRPQSSGVREVH